MFIAIAFGLVLPSSQWSGDAHRVIASIASRFLSQSGQYFVSEHLCGRDLEKIAKSLIDVSVYADSVEWSDELHFSHTPYRKCGSFNMGRDCGGNGRCIVTAIGNYTSRASDLELTMNERAEAIKFLVHLVADIHNPVHVGFAKDKGGNDIWLQNPAEKSLHNVWDYELVARQEFEVDSSKEGGWKLSETLLRDLRKNGSWKQYLLKIERDDVSSRSKASEVAGRIASQIALDYTCPVAYKNEKAKWIESGDSLTEEYFASRSRAAMELIKQAGVRLAELLDAIARHYEAKKREFKDSLDVSKKRLPVQAPENRFLTLDFDFDAEELLYEYDEAVGSYADLIASKKSGVTISARKKKMVASRANRHNEQKERKHDGELSAPNPSMLFEGIDLDQVVLVKKQGLYIVTSKTLVDNQMFGRAVMTYSVLFKGNTDGRQRIDFRFDMEVFGFNTLSKQLVARALSKIRNVRLEDFPTVEEMDESSIKVRRAISIEPYLLDNFHYDFPDQPLWVHLVASPNQNLIISDMIRLEVCFYHVDRVTLFVLKDTLESNKPLMRTNVYQVLDKQLELFLVDERLFEGVLSLELMGAFRILRNTFNHRLSIESLKFRRTILHELADLNIIFFGKGVERGLTLKAVKWLKDKHDARYQSYYRCHWSTSPRFSRGVSSPMLLPVEPGSEKDLLHPNFLPIACLFVAVILTYLSVQGLL